MSIYTQFICFRKNKDKHHMDQTWFWCTVQFEGNTKNSHMPRKGYQTITIKDETFELLEKLPGNSKSEKVERLIHDANAALAQPSLDPPTSSRAVIALVMSLATNWDKDHVWELVYELLELLRHPLTVPVTEKNKQIIDIPSLVRTNINRLKKTGVKNLEEIASGKHLPSVADFSIIAAELGLNEEQQRQIWTKTFNHKQEGIPNGSH